MYNKNYIDITRFLYLRQQGCYGYIAILLYIYVKIRDMYVKIPINTTRLQHIHHDYIPWQPPGPPADRGARGTISYPGSVDTRLHILYEAK